MIQKPDLKHERGSLTANPLIYGSNISNTYYLKLPSSQKKTTIKIIPQKALGPIGLVYTYGVVINGQSRRVFHSRGEVEAFLRGLYGISNNT